MHQHHAAEPVCRREPGRWTQLRCPQCRKMLGRKAGEGGKVELRCPRCGKIAIFDIKKANGPNIS